MARKNGNGNGAHKAPDASAEQIEKERQRANVVRFGHKMMDLEEQLRELKRDMKTHKVQVKDVRMFIDCQTEEGEARLRTKRDDINRILVWLGLDLGHQAEMFSQEEIGNRHHEAGKTAAYADQPAKPPAHLNQKDAQKWLSGHAEGRTALNVQRATEGFKPLAEAAGDLVEGLQPPVIGPAEQPSAAA